MQAIQEAQDIDTGVDTRTKKEMLADQMSGLKYMGKLIGETAVESIPGVGEAMLTKEVADYIGEGSYGSAAIGTAALGLGMIPGAGDILNKPLRAAAKKLRKKDADVANNMLKDTDSLETWKKQNPNPKPQKQNPDIEKAANDLLEGKITGKQYRSVVKENMPIVKINEVPEVPSFTEIVGALDKDKSAKGIIGLNKTIKNGTRVASRLDIPAYERFDKWVVSLHDAFDKKGRESLSGDILGYGKTAVLKNVEFKGSPTGAASISARKTNKSTIARIFGDYINAEPENVEEYARQVIKDKSWTQVGYNPFRHGFFYDKDTSMPIKSAEEVIQVGPLVLAKNAQKIKISEAKQVGPKGGLKIRTGKPIEGLKNLKETKTVFNEGGTVMDRQMDMFQDGGLEQDGGTIDPISGNDVPPGSAQEEVRDDIPAQLSEGEFVFPADVVRYIGLEKLMRLRQEAKMGLKMMEEMGQMGNADEATMPDDLPFDINDLDMDDEIGDNNEIEMQVGGMVPSIPPGIPTPQQQVFGISGFQQAAAPTTGVAAIPEAASQQFVQPVARPAQAAVPTMKQFDQQEIPSFADFTGGDFGGYDELRQYRNEAGNVINVPFRNGQPISPIPEGYTFVDPEATQTEDVTTTSTTPQTTSVRMEDADSQSRDEARRKEEERKFGPGSGRLSIGEDTFGVSFDMPDGFIPGAMGALGTSFGLLTGKPLPAGVNVNFKFEDDEFTLTSGEYNRLKKSIQETGSKSAQTKNLFKDLKQQDQRRKDAVAAREAIRFGEIDGRIVSREEERKDTEEKAAKFTDAMKENNLVFDKTTGAIVMKDGTSAQKQKDFMDYVASMATDDDEDDAADDRQFKEQQRQDSAGLPQAEISSAGAASNRGGSRGGTQSGATGGGYGGGFSDRGRFAAKGGLMEAPKPKAKKKMKRGGLASKK